MNTLQADYAQAHAQGERTNLLTRFMNWCEGQEKNRLAWLGIALVGQGCVITPFSIMAITLSGNNFLYWPFVSVAIVMCLVVNLAAMPTKITIPVFALSLLVDLLIIANCLL